MLNLRRPHNVAAAALYYKWCPPSPCVRTYVATLASNTLASNTMMQLPGGPTAARRHCTTQHHHHHHHHRVTLASNHCAAALQSLLLPSMYIHPKQTLHWSGCPFQAGDSTQQLQRCFRCCCWEARPLMLLLLRGSTAQHDLQHLQALVNKQGR